MVKGNNDHPMCLATKGKTWTGNAFNFSFRWYFRQTRQLATGQWSSHLPYLESFFSSLKTNHILYVQGNVWWLFFKKYFSWLHFVSHIFQFIAEPAVVDLPGKFPMRSQSSNLWKPFAGLLFSIELEMDWGAVNEHGNRLEVNLVWKVTVFPVWYSLAIWTSIQFNSIRFNSIQYFRHISHI